MSQQSPICLPLPPGIQSEFQVKPPNDLDPPQFSAIELRQKRENEFAAGRQLARVVLERAGGKVAGSPNADSPIVKQNPDRSPNWPTGFVGSISHSRNWLWVVAARLTDFRSLGIDTEVIVADSQANELRDSIGSESEWRALEDLKLCFKISFSLLFSAKEAFFKCWYPLTKTMWEFSDVELIEATQCNHPGENITGKLELRYRSSSSEESAQFRSSKSFNPGRTLSVLFELDAANVYTITWLDTDRPA